MDTIWEKQYTQLGTLVRYADDLVILSHKKEQALESIQVLKAVFRKLELTMNTTKSKLVNIWRDDQGFDFLGYHHRRLPVMRERTGIFYLLRSFPSKKAMKKMRDKVKKETASRSLLTKPMNEVVKKLNPIIRGWRNYYADIDPAVSNRFLQKIDWHIRRRLMIFWNKKHKKKKTSILDFAEVLRHIRILLGETVCPR